MKHVMNTAVLIAVVAYSFLLPGTVEGADEQRAVLITGASTGIGRNAAERLAREGYFVYAGARKASDIEALNKIDNVQAVRLDVTRQDEIDAAVAFIKQQGRGLWGVVNNAGINISAPLIEADMSELEFLFDVNVYGVFRVTKAFAPMIIESGGRIVNISSISGVLASRDSAMYAASKHALEAFTDSLSKELVKLGVFVTAVNPGNFASEIGLTRCKRVLEHEHAKPWVYFEERRQETLERCRERLKAGGTSKGAKPDAVSTAILHALFDENPKGRYLVVPNQEEARWTIEAAIEGLLELNAGHEHSYTRDELVEMIDAGWP